MCDHSMISMYIVLVFSCIFQSPLLSVFHDIKRSVYQEKTVVSQHWLSFSVVLLPILMAQLRIKVHISCSYSNSIAAHFLNPPWLWQNGLQFQVDDPHFLLFLMWLIVSPYTHQSVYHLYDYHTESQSDFHVLPTIHNYSWPYTTQLSIIQPHI